MKFSSLTRLIVAILSAASLTFVVASAPSQSATAATKKLLWSQEFNGTKRVGVDKRYFTHDLGNGFGWGNNEKQYYTASSSNILTDGKGNLVITAKRIPETSSILNFCDDCQFTSAKVKTADKLGFMYGRLEARIKTPAGSGMWPAFWMLGASLTDGDTWPDCGEIDILEGKGSEPNRVYGTIHGPGYFGGDGSQRGYGFDNMVPLTSGFNVYAIEWRKNAIDFYFNNNKYYSITAAQVKPNAWVFNKEFFLILNLATGGNFEPNIDPSVQSGSLSIDYIRYYSINGVGKLIKH
ncbi:MAG: family 16 glycosylhydrolase [Actinobacteria bacterium]|uniref:Unannotated protein n=1 Tax=freshwater metagenome TaxID=449393 RepID=A0A6J6NS32_9ZZZZ|nr:family 16 glycosylhydrolase [Actinomycetota bacterium]